MDNPYEILGVERNATKEDIKKAYRAQSKKYHPDINPDGEEMFKKISVSYDTLMDDNKRNQYDNPAAFGGTNIDPEHFRDMMNNFMGKNRQQKSPDKRIRIDITPQESYLGGTKKISYDVMHSCNDCNGTGGEKKICEQCKGHGYIMAATGNEHFQQITHSECQACHGTGHFVINACDTCNGVGKVKKTEELIMTIPVGVDNGEFLRAQGKGNFDVRTGYGDLLVQIVVTPSDNFEKMGRDLVYYLTVSPVDILIKKDIEIPHPSGNIQIKIPDDFETNKPLRIKNKGYNNAGDFFIKIGVINKELSTEDKEELKNILN